MSAYSYTPLDYRSATSTHRTKQLFTRLLTIHKGEYEDDIEVDLEVVDLGEGTPSRPEYEALSYVWGFETKPCTVFVGEDKRTIPITTNLDEALRHLRYQDRPIYMWIDALCIDQGNRRERSRQVSYMSHIFWSAPRIVVWLGPSAEDSECAMETLEYIGSRLQLDRRYKIHGVTELDDARWAKGWLALPLNKRQSTAILALMQRPWFERIWIRQEVFKANDKSLVICGRKAVAWPDFQRGMYCCVRHLPSYAFDPEQLRQLLDRCVLISSLLQTAPFSLKWLRRRTIGTLCTDPRDRIYALLGLLNKREKELGIVPDYSKTTPDLYQDVALRYVEIRGQLDILQSCGRGYPSSDVSALIPTWVPDWSVPGEIPLPLYLPGYSAFCPFKACTQHIGNGVLRAAGVSIGTIQNFMRLSASTKKELAAEIRALVPVDATGKPYPGGGNLWDAYRITLCVDYFGDRTEPPHHHIPRTSLLSLSIQDSKEAMRSIMSAEDLPNNNNFLRLVRRWHRTGWFFITREGYFGWGPPVTEEGDQIVTFLGCQVPIMIRRSLDLDSKHFKIIGSCYIHGFMCGEALLGPFPDSIRPVLHIEDDLNHFHDSRTGDIAVEDLRLKTLLADLGTSREGKGKGKGDKKNLDIGPEVWRSRGVEVIDFDLI